MTENDVFSKAYAELESPSRQIGLWARCFSEANGDESKAKAAYLQIRVKDLTMAQAPEKGHPDEAAKPRPMLHAFEGMNSPPPEETKQSNWKLWLYIPLGLFVAFMTFGFFASKSDAEQAKIDNPADITANQEVVLIDSVAFACQFETDFASALEHHAKGETTAWAKIVFNEPYCFGAEASSNWTVLYVRGNVAKIGITTVAQYEKLDERQRDRYKKEYITAVKWLKPAGVPAK